MSTEETINTVTVEYDKDDICDNVAMINTWSIVLMILTLLKCLQLLISQVFSQVSVFWPRKKEAYQIRNTGLSKNFEELTFKGTKIGKVRPHKAYLLEKEESCMKVFAPNRKVPVTLTSGNITFKTDTTFDTGCSISMINSKLLAAYGLKPKPVRGYTVKDASGQVMPIDGAINLEIRLGRNTTNARFIVSPVVSETLISASD